MALKNTQYDEIMREYYRKQTKSNRKILVKRWDLDKFYE